MRKPWETLVGDVRSLEYLAWLSDAGPSDPHPLQDRIEDLVEELLTETERQVFYMRFGERAPHREIAERMGYQSHRVIQIIEERIMDKIKEALDARDS